MGTIKGSASYLRFMIEGEPPARFPERFEQAIEARRFLPISQEREENEQVGWALFGRPFDDEVPITREFFLFGDLIAISYREDRVALPKPLLDHLVRKRMEELRARGEEVNRHTKRTVEAAVAAELRLKVLPRSRVVDLVWDISRRELRIFGRGPLASERAAGLFERTFEVQAKLAHYGQRAFSIDMSLRAKGVLESLGPEPVFQP